MPLPIRALQRDHAAECARVSRARRHEARGRELCRCLHGGQGARQPADGAARIAGGLPPVDAHEQQAAAGGGRGAPLFGTGRRRDAA
eukprot:4267224-Prymnesium_polylepis.1